MSEPEFSGPDPDPEDVMDLIPCECGIPACMGHWSSYGSGIREEEC